MNKVLLDTDIFSYILRRYSPEIILQAAAYLVEFERFTISAVTVTEIVKGWHKQQRNDRVQQFLSILPEVEVLVLDVEAHVLAGQIQADLERTGQPIGLADTLIATIAIHHTLPLITGNLSHYQRIPAIGYRLELDTWRKGVR